MIPNSGSNLHQSCSCPICCPGKWEANISWQGGIFNSKLGDFEYENIGSYSYEINNPTKAEKAVDDAWEKNK